MTGDDDTITLKDAAKHFGFKLSTLRTEADRGRLTIYQIGNRYYTTPADIRAMVQQCRVAKKAPVSISIRSAKHGSSETERASSALAAAQESMLQLRRPSPATSAPSTSPSRRARP